MTSLSYMRLLRWDDRPQLRRPVLVAAFEGWNDAGNAASEAVAYLLRAWGGKSFGAFDSEELFDFTSSRPQVRLESGEARRLDWPALTLSAAAVPGADRDVVFLSGPEPQLRWRSFARELQEMSEAVGISMAVLLGALLADVPHTRPERVRRMADYDPNPRDLMKMFRAEPLRMWPISTRPTSRRTMIRRSWSRSTGGRFVATSVN